MLKELTVTVDENLYDTLRKMNETDTLNAFLKGAMGLRLRKGIFDPKPFDPEKAAAAIEELRGSFKGDGHEVDRFLEEKRREKTREDETWARRNSESERFKKR